MRSWFERLARLRHQPWIQRRPTPTIILVMWLGVALWDTSWMLFGLIRGEWWQPLLLAALAIVPMLGLSGYIQGAIEYHLDRKEGLL